MADANIQARVSMSRVMENVTMTVTVTDVRVWKVRAWFGILFIRLAGIAFGCDVEVESRDGQPWV